MRTTYERLVVTGAFVAVTLLARASNACLNDADCLVFNPCVQATHCIDGVCVDTPKNCNDNNPCTIDSCDRFTVGCIHAAKCPSDGLVCNGEEYCCTGIFCVPGLCVHTEPPQCNDGNACTIDSNCTEPFGCNHVALNCDDGNPCTLDGCNPGSGCTHAAVADCCLNAADCPTGACVRDRTCVDHACTAGTAVNCDDGSPCTADSCDETTGCVNDPIAGCCRDAADCEAICTVDRACDAGTCTGGSPRPCDDGDPCTVDTCEVSTGCVSPERPGFAALACVCERAVPAACAGETPLKSLAKRARRACRIIARADGAPARKRTKLLGRVGALFGRAAKIATKNAGQRGMSEACGAALAERFTDDQSRALAVREQP